MRGKLKTRTLEWFSTIPVPAQLQYKVMFKHTFRFWIEDRPALLLLGSTILYEASGETKHVMWSVSKWWKYKVALNPFLRLIYHCDKKWGSPSSFLKSEQLKLKLRVFFDMLYCCYGNLLCQEDDHNLLSNDWAFVWYHYFNINWYSVVISIYQSTRAVNSHQNVRYIFHTQDLTYLLWPPDSSLENELPMHYCESVLRTSNYKQILRL